VPTNATESGITTDVKAEQLEKALSPMDVTESPITTDATLLQLEKALLAMYVTESGITTDLRAVQLLKAPLPREVTVSGMTKLPLAAGVIRQTPWTDPIHALLTATAARSAVERRKQINRHLTSNMANLHGCVLLAQRVRLSEDRT
jgi:hypothetical protein